MPGPHRRAGAVRGRADRAVDAVPVGAASVAPGPSGRADRAPVARRSRGAPGPLQHRRCPECRYRPANARGSRFHSPHGIRLSGAAPESNRPSRGLHGRTGFEEEHRFREPASLTRFCDCFGAVGQCARQSIYRDRPGVDRRALTLLAGRRRTKPTHGDVGRRVSLRRRVGLTTSRERVSLGHEDRRLQASPTGGLRRLQRRRRE